MARFRFLHAADLHLDSPLIGLARKSEEYAERVDDASRSAFDNLINLAIQEGCRFVVIAGDLFDGQWRNYRTGLFFADRMRRLRTAKIQVFIILGNHDAENRFLSRLDLADNVQVFPHLAASSIYLEDLETVIHGRSFPQRDVTENLALSYPARVEGRFNIGLLHTACAGSDGHAIYAPCTFEQLANHRYDYWALGHVHAMKVLSTAPYTVYPGNLQGRHVRETGPKGAMVVTVEGGKVVQAEHRPLDVIRWAVEDLDIGSAADLAAVRGLVRERIEQCFGAAEGRGLALRLVLSGQSSLHGELVGKRVQLREETEMLAKNISGELWIEKLEIRTRPPERAESPDPTIAGKLRSTIEELTTDPKMTLCLEARLAEIKAKMPATAHVDELFTATRADGMKRARELALSLLEAGQE